METQSQETTGVKPTKVCKYCAVELVIGKTWGIAYERTKHYLCNSCKNRHRDGKVGKNVLPAATPTIEYEEYPVIEGLKDSPQPAAPRVKRTEEGFVYLIPCPYGFRVTKIGWTQDLKQRLSQLQVGHHGLLQYAAYFRVKGEYVEKLCQEFYKSFWIRGEHYSLHSWEVVDTVKKICLEHSTSGRDAECTPS